MCPLTELGEIIDHIVLHLLCFLPWLSSQSSHIHKQNSQNNAQEQTVRQTVLCFWTNDNYPSTGTSFLTLIYPSYLTYEVIFFNNWQLEFNSRLTVKHAKSSTKKHLLESISAPLKCQDLYLQIHWAFFSSFLSWRYPAKTAGFCRSASLNVFIFTTNVRRVEIFWLRKTDSCSSEVCSMLPSLKKKSTHIPW